MLRFLLGLFPKPPSDRKRKQKEEENINSLIRRYSSGNIPLQNGMYITNEDAARLKAQALRRRF